MPERAYSATDRPSTGAVGARIGELFADHGRMVYGLCRLLLRDPVEAEDAAQQTFLSAHASLLGGAVPRKPAAWLAMIARNECLGRIRARMREPLPLDERRDRGGEWPEDAVARTLQMQELNRALWALPDRQRQAFVLRELYGLRYREVCSALGMSLPAVQSLLLRARRQLRAKLRPLHVAPALALPSALRDALTEAVPGFATGTAGVGGGAGVVAALVAKAAAAPAGAKVAAATVAASAVGTTGVATLAGDAPLVPRPPTARAEPTPTRVAKRPTPRPPTPVRVATPLAGARPAARTERDDEDESGHDQRGRSEDRDHSGPGRGAEDGREARNEPGAVHAQQPGEDRSGPGHGAERVEDRSGPGHGAERVEDRSGPGHGGQPVEAEEPANSGPPPAPTTTETAEQSGPKHGDGDEDESD